MLREDTEACVAGESVSAITLLALFDSVRGEVFSDSPGAKLTCRVAGVGRALSNITREAMFDPPMQQYNRSGRAFWSRRPRQPLDVDAWRSGVLAAEQFAAPVLRPGS